MLPRGYEDGGETDTGGDNYAREDVYLAGFFDFAAAGAACWVEEVEGYCDYWDDY